MKTRNTKIEVLRLVLMCFIFAWHLIVHGLDFEYVGKGVVEYSNRECKLNCVKLQ